MTDLNKSNNTSGADQSLATVHGYDNLRKCPVCGGNNKVKVTDSLDYITLEAETECYKCGDKNFWAHGFFMNHNKPVSTTRQD